LKSRKLIAVLTLLFLAANVSGDKPTAKFNFNESSSPLVDRVGGESNGSWQGGVTSGVPGLEKDTGDWDTGLAYEFDGIDDWVKIGNPAELDASQIQDNLSVAFAFRIEDYPESTGNYRLLSHGSDSTNDNLNFDILDKDGDDKANDLSIYIDEPDSGVSQPNVSNLQTDTWYYGQMNWYSNGTACLNFNQSLKKSCVSGKTGDIATSSAPWSIGSRGGTGNYFNGTIDQVMIDTNVWNQTEQERVWANFTLDATSGEDDSDTASDPKVNFSEPVSGSTVTNPVNYIFNTTYYTSSADAEIFVSQTLADISLSRESYNPIISSSVKEKDPTVANISGTLWVATTYNGSIGGDPFKTGFFKGPSFDQLSFQYQTTAANDDNEAREAAPFLKHLPNHNVTLRYYRNASAAEPRPYCALREATTDISDKSKWTNRTAVKCPGSEKDWDYYGNADFVVYNISNQWTAFYTSGNTSEEPTTRYLGVARKPAPATEGRLLDTSIEYQPASCNPLSIGATEWGIEGVEYVNTSSRHYLIGQENRGGGKEVYLWSSKRNGSLCEWTDQGSILGPTSSGWDSSDVGHPGLYQKKPDTLQVVYMGEDGDNDWDIGVATDTDWTSEQNNSVKTVSGVSNVSEENVSVNLTGFFDLASSVESFIRITDSIGNTIDSEVHTFTVDDSEKADNTPPTSSDNWSASGFVDKSEATVEIIASDSSSGVEDIYYRVNGGSYSVVQGSSATVTISSQGNNTLEYYAEDSAGNVEVTNTEYVALESNSAPSASFTTTTNDLTVNVDASGSSDSDGSISSYEWDWTNDGTYEATGQTNSHTYGSEGTYNVKLRVTDDDGAVDTKTKTVTVEKPLNFERTVDPFNDLKLYDEGYYDSGINSADGSFDLTGEKLLTVAGDLESNFVTSPIQDKWQVGESITMTFDIQEVIQKPSSSRPNLQFAAILDGRHPQMKVGGHNDTHIQVSIKPKDNTVADTTQIYDLGGGEQPADTTLAITPIEQTANNDITFRYTVQRSDGSAVYNESFTNSYSESLGKTSYIQLVHRGEDIPDVASGKSEYKIDSLSYEPYVQGNVAPEIGLVRFGNGVNDFTSGETLGERLAIQLKGLKDPDGNFKEADIVVKENGNQIFSTTVTQTGTVSLLDITEIKAADYTVEGTLTDDKGKTTSFTASNTVQEEKPVINLGAPGDGQTLTFNLNQKNKKNVEFDFQIEDNNNFDGSYSILLNGSSIKTGSFTASEFNSNDELDVQTFANVSPGTYNHTLQVTNSETGNTFVSSGNLGQTTFTVEGAEAQPSFTIDSPTDGETIFYNKNDRNDADVTVSGSVDTTFSGNADVLLDGATVAAFDFENGTTSFSESFTAANGSHNVKISLTSDTTGTVYNSSTRTFTVEGVDEVPPEITVTQPDLNADADRVDEVFNYNVSFDSEINGTGEIFLRHNNGSKIGIIQDNLDISPGVTTKTGSFTIPSQFRYVGTYEVVGQVNSSKGNVYDSKNTLFILPETSFRDLQPNDTTVNTGGDSNATVTLSGVAEISADGTLQIQVKQPSDSAFKTVTTKQFTGFGKDRSYSVDAKFTDITYPEINGNRSTSKDYKYRVKYKLNDETAKGVNQVYTSNSKSFNFSKEAEGVFTRTLKQATNILSTAVPPIFGLLALGASIFLTARETDSNIAIIVVALTASGILIRLGLFPFLDMITGLPGLLVLLGVLLYLANNMGEVIS